MEKREITVKILNRSFPVLVNQKEEESVLKAARMIEQKLVSYQNKFNLHDQIALTVMCCLEIATDLELLRQDNEAFRQKFANDFRTLEQMYRQVSTENSLNDSSE